MSVDISHLHNLLRDHTRARILELLDQRTSLSYVELQDLLGISHTGKLNYHLKMLGDLLVKDQQSGRYGLGEKGNLAVGLLSKFQTVAAVSDPRRNLATGLMFVGLMVTVLSLSYVTQYVQGFSSMGQALYGIGWAGVGLLAAWLFREGSTLRTLVHLD